MAQISDGSTNNDDIILDFFAGSGTTAHAVLDLNREDSGNRQFILVEQMDSIENVILPRIQKVVENNADKEILSRETSTKENFVYVELKEYNQAFMDKIHAAESTEVLVALWHDIAKNSFLNWYVNAEIPEDAVEAFIEIGQGENGLEEQKKLLAELLDKNQLYVNLSEIDDEDFGVSAEDKGLNKQFYGES